MSRKQLVRDVKRVALARMEDAARTEEDFKAVVEQWNHLDDNRERRERYHEIGRSTEEMLHWDKTSENDEKGKMKGGVDTVIPSPLEHPWWRQLIRGDFLDTIYDNDVEMWQLVGDGDVAYMLKKLTNKQRNVLFLSVVRLCTVAQIACYYDKTERAVRKLRAASLDSIRSKLVLIIAEQIETASSRMTYAKRNFFTWYIKDNPLPTKAVAENGAVTQRDN